MKKGSLMSMEAVMALILVSIILLLVIIPAFTDFGDLFLVFLNSEKEDYAAIKSFDNLFLEIKSLKEGESKIIPYFIEGEYYLVSYDLTAKCGSPSVCLCEDNFCTKLIKNKKYTFSSKYAVSVIDEKKDGQNTGFINRPTGIGQKSLSITKTSSEILIKSLS